MKVTFFLAGFLAFSVQATPHEEASLSFAKEMVGSLVKMNIESNCLKKTDGARTYIANAAECNLALNKLTKTLSEHDGFENELDYIQLFTDKYQLSASNYDGIVLRGFISELESTIDSQMTILNSPEDVASRIGTLSAYNTLCEKGYKMGQCEKVATELDLVMRMVSESLNTSTTYLNHNAEIWRELKVDYYRSLACMLPSGEVNQECMSK